MSYYNMGFTGDPNDVTDLDECTDADAGAHTGTDSLNSPPVMESKPFDGCFTFMDFCPQYKRKPDDWFFRAEYQTFSDIFTKVNDWLSDNPKWEVKTAETLIYDSITGFGQRLPFLTAKNIRRNLRGVRLWLCPRSQSRTNPQKIGCINVVPRIKIPNRESDVNESVEEVNKVSEVSSVDKWSLQCSSPQYESLDEVLKRLNDLLMTKPINGKILSIETVPIPVDPNRWSVDTETSFWSDQCQQNNNTLYILRAYFEYGSATLERIEVIDFVPDVQIWDTPMAVPIYETFSSLLTRSSQWLREQSPGLRFLSCNAVEVPIDEAFNIDQKSTSDVIDSRKMFYERCGQIVGNEEKPSNKCIVKFLRLSVARPQDSSPESHFPPNLNTVILNCKIFVPNKISTNGNETEFESINSSKRKIEAWLMTTGAKILSAETTIVSIPFSSSSIATSLDSCMRSESHGVPGFYLTAYRIYIDGFYLEPPTKLLPLNILDKNDENSNESSCNLM